MNISLTNAGFAIIGLFFAVVIARWAWRFEEWLAELLETFSREYPCTTGLLLAVLLILGYMGVLILCNHIRLSP
jgi:small-conductance mechanosensitive channel